MNLLILGDVVGSPGKEILQSELPKIIKEKNIDFTIVNGENCNDTGFGITKKDFNFLTDLGANVITSGNHIWDQSETTNYIDQEQRLLRPFNLPDGSPGNGYGTFKIKESYKFKPIFYILIFLFFISLLQASNNHLNIY